MDATGSLRSAAWPKRVLVWRDPRIVVERERFGDSTRTVFVAADREGRIKVDAFFPRDTVWLTLVDHKRRNLEWREDTQKWLDTGALFGARPGFRVTVAPDESKQQEEPQQRFLFGIRTADVDKPSDTRYLAAKSGIDESVHLVVLQKIMMRTSICGGTLIL